MQSNLTDSNGSNNNEWINIILLLICLSAFFLFKLFNKL